MVLITGGVSIPITMGHYSASWPFGVLETFEEGVGIWLQPRWLENSAMLRYRTDSGGADDFVWMVKWSEISEIDQSPRSVFIKPVKRRRGCRFVVLFSVALKPFIAEARERGVVVRDVSSTWRLLYS